MASTASSQDPSKQTPHHATDSAANPPKVLPTGGKASSIGDKASSTGDKGPSAEKSSSTGQSHSTADKSSSTGQTATNPATKSTAVTSSAEEKRSQQHHDTEKAKSGSDEESLTTILDSRQRTELTILLAAASAIMRDDIAAVFDASATISPELRDDKTKSEDDKIMNPNIDPGSVDVAARDRERKMLQAREKELAAPRMRELRDAALDWYDAWRVGVIGRVGEVVNSAKEAKKQISSQETLQHKPDYSNTSKTTKMATNDSDQPQTPAQADEAGTRVLQETFPPIETPLAKLDESKRALILHSMLLLLLSLEHYPAPSRILLLHLTSSLHLPLSTLIKDEETTAQGLLASAKELSGKSETEKKAAEGESARKWKVGLATVAGAAVVGITGGLAAPLMAAGIGSVMSGLGLGATAAAGYLGTLAGSTVVVGGLFGAYGGRMTGQMMDNYAREVRDFAFLPLRGPDAAEAARNATAPSDHKPSEDASAVHSDHQAQGSNKAPTDTTADEKAGQRDPADRRLRVTIGISGWLTSPQEVVTPWSVLGDGSETFALRWELESLMNLGHALEAMVSSAAWGYAKKELISRTIFAEMMSAMWPVALLQVGRVVDNPFSVTKSRAEKAGSVLADALINRAQGERPVTLIGYSLGARVIYACLLSLASRRAFGLIDSVVLIGAPVPSDARDWRVMRAVVSGRLVNAYSSNDYILGFLYRTSSVQLGVAGLQPVKDVRGVENVDVSDVITGHLRYRFLVGRILRAIGFEDLDEQELQREAEAFERIEEEERQRTEAVTKQIPDRLKNTSLTGSSTTASGDGSQEKSSSQDSSSGDASKENAPTTQTAQAAQETPQTDSQSVEAAEKEAQSMEATVRQRTQQSLMQRGAELLTMTGLRSTPKSATSGSDKAQRNTTGKHVAAGDDAGAALKSSSQDPSTSSGQADTSNSYMMYARKHWPFTTNRSQSYIHDATDADLKSPSDSSGTSRPKDEANASSANSTDKDTSASTDEGSTEKPIDGRSYLEMAGETWRGIKMPSSVPWSKTKEQTQTSSNATTTTGAEASEAAGKNADSAKKAGHATDPASATGSSYLQMGKTYLGMNSGPPAK